jgi:tetratricopeptide (TPR) repeat protein
MLWSQAAILYLEVKPTPDNAKAKADADKALAIDPNSALGNYAAGIALARQGSRKEALVFLGKADAAAKTSGDTRVATLSEAAIATISGAK